MALTFVQLQVLVLVLVLNLVLPASASHFMSVKSTFHLVVDDAGNQVVSGMFYFGLLLSNFVDFQPIKKKTKKIEESERQSGVSNLKIEPRFRRPPHF